MVDAKSREGWCQQSDSTPAVPFGQCSGGYPVFPLQKATSKRVGYLMGRGSGGGGGGSETYRVGWIKRGNFSMTTP
eukprot:764004-Hanusia_phi.AAC.1